MKAKSKLDVPIALWITDQNPPIDQLKFCSDLFPEHDIVGTNKRDGLFTIIGQNNIDTIITTLDLPFIHRLLKDRQKYNTRFSRMRIYDKYLKKEILIDEYVFLAGLYDNDLLFIKLIIPYFDK